MAKTKQTRKTEKEKKGLITEERHFYRVAYY
jgi:hypothetical protein